MPSFNEDSKQNTFGFGKQYKDYKIEDVPNSYLEWVLENCSNIENSFREIIKSELRGRDKLGIVVNRDDGVGRNKWWKEDIDWQINDGLPF